MKIGLVASHGGHLGQLQSLLRAFEGHEVFYITYDSARTRALPNVYFLSNFVFNPFSWIRSAWKIWKILRKEKPKCLVSTGAELAIPAFYLAKLLGIKTAYIESVSRVHEVSLTGKAVYPVTDLFLVQHPGALGKAGKRARFAGGLT